MSEKMNLADRIAEIEQSSNLRALDVSAGKGSFIALTQAEWSAVKALIADRDRLKAELSSLWSTVDGD